MTLFLPPPRPGTSCSLSSLHHAVNERPAKVGLAATARLDHGLRRAAVLAFGATARSSTIASWAALLDPWACSCVSRARRTAPPG
eukprot:scaffold58109_cov75-Phaeocystis_antarctica.AAC.1